MSWACARALRSIASSPARSSGSRCGAPAQDLRPAEDRGERRAQLVGEVREEFVLDAARPLGVGARCTLAVEQPLALFRGRLCRGLGALLLGNVAEAPHPSHRPPFDHLSARNALERAAVRELQEVEALRRGGGADVVELREKCLGRSRLAGHGLEHRPLLAAAQDLERDAPHLGEPLVEVGDLAVLVDDQDAVGGRLQRGTRHR